MNCPRGIQVSFFFSLLLPIRLYDVLCMIESTCACFNCSFNIVNVSILSNPTHLNTIPSRPDKHTLWCRCSDIQTSHTPSPQSIHHHNPHPVQLYTPPQAAAQSRNKPKPKTTDLTPAEPIRIAVIGGTGLQSLPGFKHKATVRPHTPWGETSAPIAVLEHAPSSSSTGPPSQTPTGPLSETPAKPTPIAFLPRHGQHHQYAPHEVPNRANIAALRRLGVRTIVAFSAVGSLREEIRPRDFVLPDQIIDRTKGVRLVFFSSRFSVAWHGGGNQGLADAKPGRLRSSRGVWSGMSCSRIRSTTASGV